MAASTRPSFFREFAAGFGHLIRGFSYWKRRPLLMLLGLLPAAIVAIVLGALLLLLGLNLERISAAITPFADQWDAIWIYLLRITISVALFAAAAILSAFAFTALSLIAGEPVYAKIWHEVEHEFGPVPDREPGFWRSVGDAGRLVLQAIVAAIIVGLISFIPVVGAPIAAVSGYLISSRIIALELTARSLEARGLSHSERLRLLRSLSPRVVGFGVAVHLCYLIPTGAVLVMPAAVAGATLLGRHVVQYHELEPKPEAPEAEATV
jgi:CysZ protein